MKKWVIILTIIISVIVVFLLVLFLKVVILQKGIIGIVQVEPYIKDEVNRLFNEDPSRKVAVVPDSGLIIIPGGEHGSFSFSIKNVGDSESKFRYYIQVSDPERLKYCNIEKNEAESWISVTSGSMILSEGEMNEVPEYITFLIPPGTPPCIVKYELKINEDGIEYIDIP